MEKLTTATELKTAFECALVEILDYWTAHATAMDGGFNGEVDNSGKVINEAPISTVMVARILWTFSSAHKYVKQEKYEQVAHLAFYYLKTHCIDVINGGVFWSLNANGSVLDSKKQIYALAFSIYGMTAYHRMTASEEALGIAKLLYRNIEKYSFDPSRGGYYEAFDREWQPLADFRLSAKDANEKKTMNTHLHILEAYSSLYKVWKNDELRQRLRSLIENFHEYILDKTNGHLRLFMDENWNAKSATVSYGHDIEASWLLTEAANVLEDPELIGSARKMAIDLANAAAEGLRSDGSLIYEYEPGEGYVNAERHWWVQAEAIVGFYNAYELSAKDKFYEYAIEAWRYTDTEIIDHQYGEWFWGRDENGAVIPGQGKIGFWKCPYHNGRACMEMISRLTDSIT